MEDEVIYFITYGGCIYGAYRSGESALDAASIFVAANDSIPPLLKDHPEWFIASCYLED